MHDYPLVSILKTESSTKKCEKSVHFSLPDRVPERRRSDRDVRHSQLSNQLNQTARRFNGSHYKEIHQAVVQSLTESHTPIVLCFVDQELLYWPLNESVGTEFLYWLELLRKAGEQWPNSPSFTVQHMAMIRAALNPMEKESQALFQRLFDSITVGQFKLRLAMEGLSLLMGVDYEEQWNTLYHQQLLLEY